MIMFWSRYFSSRVALLFCWFACFVVVSSISCSDYRTCSSCLSASDSLGCEWCQPVELGSCFASTDASTDCPNESNRHSDNCPSLTNATASTLSGISYSFSAGTTQYLNLTAFSLWGHPRTFGGDNVQVVFDLPAKYGNDIHHIGNNRVLDNGKGQYAIVFCPNLVGRLEVTIILDGNVVEEYNATVLPISAPTISSASLNSNGKGVNILFDSFTDMAKSTIESSSSSSSATVSRFDCALLFKGASSIFGATRSFCSWVAPDEVVAILGTDSSIAAGGGGGSKLCVLNSTLSAQLDRSNTSSVDTDCVEISFPSGLSTTSVITGPSIIPASSNGTFSIWNSVYTMLSYCVQWKLESCSASTPASLVSFMNEVQNMSSFVLPGSLLPTSGYCTLSMNLTSILFNSWDSNSVQVSAVATNPPSADLPSIWIVEGRNGIFCATSSSSSCRLSLAMSDEPVLSSSVQDSISVDWSCSNGQTSSDSFILVSNGLSSEVVNCSVNVSSSALAQYREISNIPVSFFYADLVAIVWSPNEISWNAESLLFEAGDSFDPSNRSARYLTSWSCLNDAGIDGHLSSFPNNRTLVLSMSTLRSLASSTTTQTLQFKLSFSVNGTMNGRSAVERTFSILFVDDSSLGSSDAPSLFFIEFSPSGNGDEWRNSYRSVSRLTPRLDFGSNDDVFPLVVEMNTTNENDPSSSSIVDRWSVGDLDSFVDRSSKSSPSSLVLDVVSSSSSSSLYLLLSPTLVQFTSVLTSPLSSITTHSNFEFLITSPIGSEGSINLFSPNSWILENDLSSRFVPLETKLSVIFSSGSSSTSSSSFDMNVFAYLTDTDVSMSNAMPVMSSSIPVSMTSASCVRTFVLPYVEGIPSGGAGKSFYLHLSHSASIDTFDATKSLAMFGPISVDEVSSSEATIFSFLRSQYESALAFSDYPSAIYWASAEIDYVNRLSNLSSSSSVSLHYQSLSMTPNDGTIRRNFYLDWIDTSLSSIHSAVNDDFESISRLLQSCTLDVSQLNNVSRDSILRIFVSAETIQSDLDSSPSFSSFVQTLSNVFNSFRNDYSKYSTSSSYFVEMRQRYLELLPVWRLSGTSCVSTASDRYRSGDVSVLDDISITPLKLSLNSFDVSTSIPCSSRSRLDIVESSTFSSSSSSCVSASFGSLPFSPFPSAVSVIVDTESSSSSSSSFTLSPVLYFAAFDGDLNAWNSILGSMNFVIPVGNDEDAKLQKCVVYNYSSDSWVDLGESIVTTTLAFDSMECRIDLSSGTYSSLLPAISTPGVHSSIHVAIISIPKNSNAGSNLVSGENNNLPVWSLLLMVAGGFTPLVCLLCHLTICVSLCGLYQFVNEYQREKKAESGGGSKGVAKVHFEKLDSPLEDGVGVGVQKGAGVEPEESRVNSDEKNGNGGSSSHSSFSRSEESREEEEEEEEEESVASSIV